MLCLRSASQVRKRGRRLAYSVRKHASALSYTDLIEVQRLNHISLVCFTDQGSRRRRLQDIEEASTFAAEVVFTGQQHFQNGVNRSRKKHSWHEENYQRVYCSSILPSYLSRQASSRQFQIHHQRKETRWACLGSVSNDLAWFDYRLWIKSNQVKIYLIKS